MATTTKRWHKAVVTETHSIRDVIQVLDAAALRIALVLDDSGRLLGTVTDGDIRRAILQHAELDETVCNIMCADPKVINYRESTQTALSILESFKLQHLPVLDDDQKLVDLYTLEQLIQKPRYDNPVFLMAGGFGTRLRPLTNSCPKPMLKVGTKPILEIILDSFVSAGFHQFYISTHYLPDMIHEHFGDGSRWGVNIEYIHENRPLGTAGALGLLPKSAHDLPCFVMNGDILTNVDFLELLNFHSENSSAVTTCVRKYEYQIPYGVVTNRGHQVESIEEKPVNKYFVNAGIYLLNPDIVKNVVRELYLDMPDLLQNQIGEGNAVNMFPIHEYWLDIGKMDDFNRAQVDVSEVIGG